MTWHLSNEGNAVNVKRHLDVARNGLLFLSDFMRQAEVGEIDVEAMARAEFDEATRSWLESHGVAF